MDYLHVYESGVPGSPAVMFLHGAAVSGRMWSDHMARLSGYHCLAPDLPGFGRSNSLRWRSRFETADQIADIIESRTPARRAHVVGLSLGGSVAHTLLAHRPDLLDRVIVDGAGVLPWRGNGPFTLGLAAIAPFLHLRPVIAALSHAVGGLSELDKMDIQRASRRSFLRSWIQANATRITQAEVTASCPTLLVAGERETVVRTSNAALAALMPNAVARYVPGTGHGWLGSKPDLHFAMVEAWLAGTRLPDGLVPETVHWPEPVVDRILAAEQG